MAVCRTNMPISATAPSVRATLIDVKSWREQNPSFLSTRDDAQVGSFRHVSVAQRTTNET
jgi:hypothetical protein